MDLYIQPLSLNLEKNASEVTLPENANIWPNEIMQELYKQVPYIADFDPHVTMDRVDAERGYGFGHVEVQNKTEMQSGADPNAMQAIGVQMVRIPVIIKDRKLQPFDVIVTADSKALPLTENRMRQALFRPQAFDVTSRTPGDMSMVGQLYPPYRQNYGFGGGGVGMSVGMGKEGSALEDFLQKEANEKEKSKSRSVPEHLGAVAATLALPVTTGAELAKRVSDRHLPGFSKGFSEQTNSWLNRGGGRKIKEGSALDEAAYLKEIFRDPSKASTQDKVHAISWAKNHPETWQKSSAAKCCSKCGEMTKCSCGMGKSAGVPNSSLSEPASTKIKDVVPRFKTGSVLRAVLNTINREDYYKVASALESPGLRGAYLKNAAATRESLSILSEYDAVSVSKTAQALESAIKPSVVQVVKLAQGYSVRSANHAYWEPSERFADRGQIVSEFGTKVALAADQSGSVTLTDTEGVSHEDGPESKPSPISSFGVYRVKDDQGQELVGFVFPNLLDLSGESLPIAAFTNGSVSALQEDIVGESVGKDSGLVFGPMQGHGMFVRQMPNGGVNAMIPMTIKGGYSEGGSNKLHVETFDGREIFVEVQPNIKSPTEIDGTCLVPEDFRWMPLNGGEVSLVSSVDEWGASKQASAKFASITVRSGGDNSFTFQGIPLSKFAADHQQFLSYDDAMLLLGGFGTNLTYAAEKLAQSMAFNAPVDIRIGRSIKLASTAREEAAYRAADKLAHIPNLRRELFKEAAFIPDPLAVDTVLSVGFVNPENIMTFVSYLPQIDQAQERLCNLLLAARLGLNEIPTGALEKTVKSLEVVLVGLKVLAFQKS